MSNTPDTKFQTFVDNTVDSIKVWTNFFVQYNLPENDCFRRSVNTKYKEISQDDDRNFAEKAADKAVALRNFKLDGYHEIAAQRVHFKEIDYAQQALDGCLKRNDALKKKYENEKNTTTSDDAYTPEGSGIGPFDRRLFREFILSNNESQDRIPFSTQFRESATTGLIVSEKYIRDSEIEGETDAIKQANDARAVLAGDLFYIGVPALQNTYALTKLYGSEGGEKLINKRGERRWYEVDQAFGTGATDLAGFSMNPTTSSLISWGNADPYGRTPYHFTDFAFAKYWNKIENNRLITLRRFGAPIVDNLKFPGMDGIQKIGTPGTETAEGTVDQGSTTKILFPPMAHAITYFGEETGNSLNALLKFTTGMKWTDVKSDVWQVQAQSTPEAGQGPGAGGLFKSLTGLSKMLAVAGGDFNPEFIMNKGQLPPDPYTDGPYENRILGPVNRIDSVKRREAGLDFDWSGLNIQFEYVARPIGGINPKAVLLDIMSNFLIIGSASAVFFGGQHRFMGNPAKYPFLGGEKGIEAWYSGKPLQWAGNTIDQFVGQVTEPNGPMAQAGDFFNQLLSGFAEGGLKGIFGPVKGLFTEGKVGANVIKQQLAEKSVGQVPYLTGMKALLTGEPVGEWHVTIGNPLNPIAMIGNLICTGIEIEFGDELGPDDFPTEMKITVKLDHGMPRDRDAIQSIFNRGMGRIYDLPDGFEGTADGQTEIDRYTANANETGTAAAIRGWLAGPSKLGGRSGPPVIKQPSNQGVTSVWSRAPFAAVSPNENLINSEGEMARSAYRAVDWLALKSLK